MCSPVVGHPRASTRAPTRVSFAHVPGHMCKLMTPAKPSKKKRQNECVRDSAKSVSGSGILTLIYKKRKVVSSGVRAEKVEEMEVEEMEVEKVEEMEVELEETDVEKKVEKKVVKKVRKVSFVPVVVNGTELNPERLLKYSEYVQEYVKRMRCRCPNTREPQRVIHIHEP